MTASTNNKVSILVENQFPAFIRDDYPKFVRFLQAYYEFVEQSGGLNDVSRSLEDSIDIDNTLPAFLDHFKAKYASGFPSTMLMNKEMLIKNASQFFSNKGTESSLRFLFRALFDEEIEVYYPNRNILRVSDGKWSIAAAFRVSDTIYNNFVGDGIRTSFNLSSTPTSIADITITINGASYPTGQCSLVGNTLTFNSTIPSVGDTIDISLYNTDFSKFLNKTMYSNNSDGYVLVTSFTSVYDNGVTYKELRISYTENDNDLDEDFKIGDYAYTYFDDPSNPLNPPIKVSIYITSAVVGVNIVDGGVNYKYGDSLNFIGGGGSGANAIVNEILSGGLTSVVLNNGGAGYLSNGNSSYFTVTGGGSPTRQANLKVYGIDASGNTHSVYYPIPADIIANSANLRMNATSWLYNSGNGAGLVGFPGNGNTAQTPTSKIETVLSYVNYGPCGPILTNGISILDQGEGYTVSPSITLATPTMTVNSSIFPITALGILGSMAVVNQGSNYVVGDELVFTNATNSLGRNAAGAVTSVTANGGIATIAFQAPRMSGTVNVSNTSNTVYGTTTNFLGEANINDTIIVNNEIRYITSIASNVQMNVSAVFVSSANTRKMGNYKWDYIGGSGYVMGLLPRITVSSVTGSGANISALAVIGAGEDVIAGQLQKLGTIKSVTITSGGQNYTTAPSISTINSANGSGANLTAVVAGGPHFYPGVFANEDGMPSSITKLQNRDFYQFFSYVIKSTKTLDMYETILKDVIHPLGMKYFAEWYAPQQNFTLNFGAAAGNIGQLAYLKVDGNGSNIGTPNSANTTMSGNTSIRAHVSLENYQNGTTQYIAGKSNNFSGGSSWSLAINATGYIWFPFSIDGTTVYNMFSSQTLTNSANSELYVRVDRNAFGTNSITFYTSTNGDTWTQFGTQLTGLAAGPLGPLFNTPGQINLGTGPAGTFSGKGKIYGVQMYDANTLKVNFDPSIAANGATVLIANTGETWTANGNAVIINSGTNVLIETY